MLSQNKTIYPEKGKPFIRGKCQLYVVILFPLRSRVEIYTTDLYLFSFIDCICFQNYIASYIIYSNNNLCMFIQNYSQLYM